MASGAARNDPLVNDATFADFPAFNGSVVVAK